jgi:hypothetical protein
MNPRILYWFYKHCYRPLVTTILVFLFAFFMLLVDVVRKPVAPPMSNVSVPAVKTAPATPIKHHGIKYDRRR